jgi:histone H3/H4
MENIDIPILPIEHVKRLIKKAGTDSVSEDAVIELAKVLEEYGLGIAKDAIILANHDKRKTIKEKDIKLANERLRKHTKILILEDKIYDIIPIFSSRKLYTQGDNKL